jgi:hypothetical protein
LWGEQTNKRGEKSENQKQDKCELGNLFQTGRDFRGAWNAAAFGRSALHRTETNSGGFGQVVKSAFHASGSLRGAARRGRWPGGGF